MEASTDNLQDLIVILGSRKGNSSRRVTLLKLMPCRFANEN